MKTCHRAPSLRQLIPLLALLAGVGGVRAGDFDDPNADRDALPTVPKGFEVSVFAREPLVRQPCSMAFDSRGRLCVGMGPQYRKPTPETPGDSVVLVLDEDGDNRADRVKTFATGFNAIQGLAWHGRDLWVANSPDLTIVRDLDGDDEADEYVRVYTDLGNLEHALHGLNWAPDGKLYMSKGNSKGLTQPDRIAPKPFRDLWGVTAPSGSPDFPEPRIFGKGEYRKSYHDPEDDWGREGGVLRCDDGGRDLEIVSRGMRNPWDIAFDSGFNWLGSDNDQTSGDRVFMPFFGAHFGWNHSWSAHWGTDAHPPTAPVSGPIFEGSGTGIIFGELPQFPPSHRGVYFINDWLRKTTFVWRPLWDGALMRPAGGNWEPFVQGGKALYRPTDIEAGPDGALWILGWGSGYGSEFKDGKMTSEGRIFRVAAKGSAPPAWRTPKRAKPLSEWSVADLVEDFDGPLPVWRINAQEELVRRADEAKTGLLEMLVADGISQARETWIAWTLGRMNPQDRTMDDWFSDRATDESASLNLRLQAVRILAHRERRRGGAPAMPASVLGALRNPEPRIRFAAVQAIAQIQPPALPPELLEQLAKEVDPTVFYAGWQALRRISDAAATKALLADPRAGVRRAALLAALEDNRLKEGEVRPLAGDPDAAVRDVASLWLRKAAEGGETVQVRGRPLLDESAPASPANQVGLARDIKAESGRPYRLVPAGLRAGAQPYTDRSYELKAVPEALLDADYIQTSNNDEASKGKTWLRFEALFPVRVFIGLDARLSAPPEWLRKAFRPEDLKIEADHWTFRLYSADFPAGRIDLGGNTEDGARGGKGNYVVVLQPLPLQAPPVAATVDGALAALAQGDRDRGQWLFHNRSGMGCFNCHQLGGHGNKFGPDLATLGERATPKHIAQSIIEPNAVVTEGYTLQQITTDEAEYSGILLEESGLTVALGLAQGDRVVIPKSKITSRESARSSAMPTLDLLTDQYVADLTAYLLTQAAPQAAQSEAPGSAALPSGEGFAFTQTADTLVITHSGQPVAEFVFQDKKIRRPFFANVHAPGGLKATRNHPPLEGRDATDHESMHPGIWLAFGDIDGADFWRNKGRIEHIRFSEPPAVHGERLTFATECRLVAPDGRVVCGLINRIALAAQPDAWLISWDATFRSEEGPFTFGDQEEMGFGARVATELAEKNGGMISSSSGLQTAKATWGRPADWCDYSGTIAGRPAGIMLLADQRNFRPSWWHNRDYGVFVANPFGRAAMGRGESSAVKVMRGEDFRLRFAAVIHAGSGFKPEAAYQAYQEHIRTGSGG